MAATIKAAAELSAVLAQEATAGHCPPDRRNPAPFMIADDAIALLRIGAGVKRWAERACNGEGHRAYTRTWERSEVTWVWDDTDTAAHERADARAIAKVQEIAARYGARVEIGGDPRGYVLRLHLASGRKNGWGDGWGIA